MVRPATPDPVADPDPGTGASATGPGLWHALAGPVDPRPALGCDADADVVIVGGGFSGLWTAYHLLDADPALRVIVLEGERLGFGASGRNGGWLMGAAPADLAVWERRFGLAAVRRAQAVLCEAVAEIAGVDALAQLGGGVRLAGSITVARSAAEEARLAERRRAMVRWGWPEGRLAWIGGDEVRARIGAEGVRGGLVTDPCGTLEPLALVRGLAAAVERLGAKVYEGSPVVEVTPGAVRTAGATVVAPRVVLATEAFTIRQPHEARRYLPLASTMVATAPLPADVRAALRWREGEAVGDAHHLFFYAQLTRDGRLAIGGRGAPYRLGSGLAVTGDADAATTARLQATIAELWPAAAEVPIEHRWSGSLAVPRDWCASCGLDERTGVAWIGGYAGHGVAASYVLGRSLAAGLRGEPDPAGTQPWTMHRARRWEPEPLRWLASQAIVRTLGAADRREDAGERPPRRLRLVSRFTG